MKFFREGLGLFELAQGDKVMKRIIFLDLTNKYHFTLNVRRMNKRVDGIQQKLK